MAKEKQKEWTRQHMLTQPQLKQLIKEKLARAAQQSVPVEKKWEIAQGQL
jgi:hypothetical protein